MHGEFVSNKSFYRPRSASRFRILAALMLQRKLLQSGISTIRGDMELICLIKCLTELALGVQREFKQEGSAEIDPAKGKKG